MDWNYEPVECVMLKDIEKFNPIELSEYAIDNNIKEDPAFNWWVGHVLCQRDHIITKVKT